MQKEAASRFIDDNFEPDDRLAIVLINRASGVVTQRIASAAQILSPQFQTWLRSENRSGRRGVFVSMNALDQQARGRTRADVAVVRHLYLDFDDSGTEAIEHLMASENMPKPNYLVNTSPDHWQVSWKVQGFGADQAEETMRGTVWEFGADPAATDVSRVLRVPGFLNHKRGGNMVRMEQCSNLIYTPDHFPRFEPGDRRGEHGGIRSNQSRRAGRISQSELDWAYAKRALARGESPDSVAKSIAEYRRFDKSDPEYYAQLTVRKAVQDLGDSVPRESSSLDR